MMRKKSSPLWGYFTILSDQFARCEICQNKLSYKTSSSNLKKHLERKHPTYVLGCNQEIESQESGDSPSQLSNVVIIEGSCEMSDDNAHIKADDSYYETVQQNPRITTKDIIKRPLKRPNLTPHTSHRESSPTNMSQESYEVIQQTPISRTTGDLKRPLKRHSVISGSTYVPIHSSTSGMHSYDQFSAFGAHIIEELKLISDVHSLRVAKMKIQQVIFEAQSGYYAKEYEKDKSTIDSGSLTEIITETVSENTVTVE